MPAPDPLEEEYLRIAASHRRAILKTTARGALPGSVTRVFASGTRATLLDVLPDLRIDELGAVKDQSAYQRWFERELEPVAATILERNPYRLRPNIHPGYDWGHGAKVLCVFVRDVVLFSRFFLDAEATRLEPFLYCPVDRVVLKRLRKLGERRLPDAIAALDRSRFYAVQDRLQLAADRVGVPRVWFDDNWGDRQA